MRKIYISVILTKNYKSFDCRDVELYSGSIGGHEQKIVVL